VEAGHRCAIPACKADPVELAHITPWAQVHKHTFDNMIALCPTCHARFDKGRIDRLAMLEYKRNLSVPSVSGAASTHPVLDSYRAFQLCLAVWEAAIQALVEADLDDAPQERHRLLVDKCTRRGQQALEALELLSAQCGTDTNRCAERVLDWVRYWASDVIDGLWPSTHPGAERHDPMDLAELEEELEVCLSKETGVPAGSLPRRPDPVASQPLLLLAGSGKRF
jgi:HNH endonuclease